MRYKEEYKISKSIRALSDEEIFKSLAYNMIRQMPMDDFKKLFSITKTQEENDYKFILTKKI